LLSAAGYLITVKGHSFALSNTEKVALGRFSGGKSAFCPLCVIFDVRREFEKTNKSKNMLSSRKDLTNKPLSPQVHAIFTHFIPMNHFRPAKSDGCDVSAGSLESPSTCGNFQFLLEKD
jgi:hypothetical protein